MQGFYEWAGMAADEIGVACCDAASVEEYVEISVRLASDEDFRRSVVARIEGSFRGQRGEEEEDEVCDEEDLQGCRGDGEGKDRQEGGKYYRAVADFIVSSVSSAKEDGTGVRDGAGGS